MRWAVLTICREAPPIRGPTFLTVVEIATITIDDVEFSKVRARRADFSGFMFGGTDPIYGILGLPLLLSSPRGTTERIGGQASRSSLRDLVIVGPSYTTR